MTHRTTAWVGMALKSSQPRRSASRKSERPILRTTNAEEVPKNSNLGLAKYCMAMARPPCSLSQGETARPQVARNQPHARKSRLSPANQVQREGALPDDTCRDRCSELSAMEAK